MKKRRGFTLAELMMAVFIFSFVAASLATIYSTANRHMFQNYRRNIVKTGVLVSMRAIQNNLSVATRVDLPLLNEQGTVLAFAVNVDQGQPPGYLGCYPISAADQASWHYFCLANDPLIPGSRSLYYHTGTIAGGPPCGDTAALNWDPNTGYAVPVCGPGGGGKVTLLMQYVPPDPYKPFSRRASEGINEHDTVRVTLRSVWSASGRGFGSSQRDVDFSLDSVVKLNRSREP